MLGMFPQLLPLLLAGVGLALIVGLVNRNKALRFLGLLLLIPLVGPIIKGAMRELPPWIALIIMAVFTILVLRRWASLLLGSRAADGMIGHLAADLVGLIGKGLLLPFRAVRWVVRRGRRDEYR